MAITITRQHLLDAARTEPLRGGSWAMYCSPLPAEYFDYKLFFGVPAKNTPSECPVCLVGGALRRAGIKHAAEIVDAAEVLTTGDSIGREVAQHINEEIKNLLDKKRYFNAASVYFEDGDWKTREDLCRWIEENIPAYFTHTLTTEY